MENLTTLLEIKYVYSADVSEQKYRYNMIAKAPEAETDIKTTSTLNIFNNITIYIAIILMLVIGLVLIIVIRIRKRKDKTN